MCFVIMKDSRITDLNDVYKKKTEMTFFAPYTMGT